MAIISDYLVLGISLKGQLLNIDGDFLIFVSVLLIKVTVYLCGIAKHLQFPVVAPFCYKWEHIRFIAALNTSDKNFGNQ